MWKWNGSPFFLSFFLFSLVALANATVMVTGTVFWTIERVPPHLQWDRECGVGVTQWAFVTDWLCTIRYWYDVVCVYVQLYCTPVHQIYQFQIWSILLVRFRFHIYKFKFEMIWKVIHCYLKLEIKFDLWRDKMTYFWNNGEEIK